MPAAHAGVVDLATFNVTNAVLAADRIARRATGCWCTPLPRYVSLAVLRDGHVIFYRTRGEESEGSIADLVHQTAMYYEDRLQGPALPAGAARRRIDGGRRRRTAARAVGPARARGGGGRSVPGGAAGGRAGPRRRWPTLLAAGVGLLRARRDRRLTVLRGNLATRPFYNERLVRVVLVAALAVGGGVGRRERRHGGQPVAAGRDAGRPGPQRGAGGHGRARRRRDAARRR